MAKFCHNSGHAVSLTQFLFNLLSTLIHSRYCFFDVHLFPFIFFPSFSFMIFPFDTFGLFQSSRSLLCLFFVLIFFHPFTFSVHALPPVPASFSFVQINKVSPTSVTRLGNYWKFPTINCLTKVAQIFWTCMGFFDNVNLFLKTAVANFWTTFGENWATF